MSRILLRGVRQNNLQDLDLEIPHGALTVVTGLSGSGKSSLAVDTLFAEGHRRFVESLSTYARQFLRRLPRPDMDRMEGIPPAILLERKPPAANSRSTVATASEIYDHLRVLYARAASARCLHCGGEVRADTIDSIVERTRRGARERGAATLLVGFAVDVPAGRRGRDVVAGLIARGFHRLIAAGELRRVEAGGEGAIPAGPARVLVDRLVPPPEAAGAGEPGGEEPGEVSAAFRSRLAGSLETAFRAGDGEAFLEWPGGEPETVRLRAACASCGRGAPSATPEMFSFNSPRGACPRCRGFGDLLDFDPALVVPDPDLSIAGGAIAPWERPAYRFPRRRLLAFCQERRIPIDRPFRRLSDAHRAAIMEGDEGYRGVLPSLRRLHHRKRYRAHVRFFLRRFMRFSRCPDCDGTRLGPLARAFRLGGKDLGEVLAMSLADAASYFHRLELGGEAAAIAARPRAEIERRLDLLAALGLGYLTLDRMSRTLSGGEAQRISLAAALGSGLTGTLYVLDEPTVGLHARDTGRLLDILARLRDLGNTLVVVEHDRAVIEAADHVLELGPGAGREGGRLVHAGSAAAFRRSDSLTARYLRDELEVAPARASRRGPRGVLTIRGAREHNLKGIDVTIPLGCLVSVTGVSGSGKTTLTRDILYRALAGEREAVPGAEPDGDAAAAPGAFDAIEGRALAGEAVLIDQSPIGTTSRSNPASYVGALAPIRELFAATREARLLGRSAGFFSFNVDGGRCETCRGEGWIRVEMQFLADILVPCEACHGTRYRSEALEVKVDGLDIAGVLRLTVDEACRHFRARRNVIRRLDVLSRVGLGYLTLGQPAPTLSGGEAQRLKIARELDLDESRHAVYILDEPTTGLHLADVRVLLRMLGELVDRGNTVVVVEHHPDLVWASDFVIDLGPDGGDAGGELVAAGTPEEVAQVAESHTGRMLRERQDRASPPVTALRRRATTRSPAALAASAGRRR